MGLMLYSAPPVAPDSPPISPDSPGLVIPADRDYAWNPGRMSVGGIPTGRPTFTTVNPSGGDDTNAIQTAIANCPSGQAVQLSAGTFRLQQLQVPLMLNKSGITLRGAGPNSTTILFDRTGAAALRLGTTIPGTTLNTPADQSGAENCPIMIVAPSRYAQIDNHDQTTYLPGSTKNLTADGVKGAMSVTVSDASIFTVGQCVLVDELTVPSFVPTPPGFLNNNTNGTEGTVTVYAGDRIVMNWHNPTQTFQDDPPDSFGWFSRGEPVNVATGSYTDGRMNCEIKEIASIVGNTITFTSPLTITYRTSHTAQVTRYSNGQGWGDSIHIRDSGIENIRFYRAGGGGISFGCAAYCWVKNVEIDTCCSNGIGMSDCFRCEIRDSYIHTSAQPTPAAESYAISVQRGSSEILVENNIIRDYCKMMVARAAGAGSVFGYNYTDDGWDFYYGDDTTNADYAKWQECGINASHMAGPHHVLFEGNYSWNADSDYTHGNSIYVAFFRNWLSGKRASIAATVESNMRCGGGAMFSYYMSYVGNVLGRSGQMSGWVYTDARMGCDGAGEHCVGFPTSGWTNGTTWSASPAIWRVGYDPERWSCNPDALTLSSLIRDGNWDWLTSSQKWHTTPSTFTIPNSMYLTSKPAFFGSNTWPWVDPSTGTTSILPAKKRYDDGTPNVVP